MTIGRTSRKVWHNTIVRIALDQEFLMHTILAVSASHKAHKEPEQRFEYLSRAAMHQDKAMQLQKVAMANPGPYVPFEVMTSCILNRKTFLGSVC